VIVHSTLVFVAGRMINGISSTGLTLEVQQLVITQALHLTIPQALVSQTYYNLTIPQAQVSQTYYNLTIPQAQVSQTY
jgi:hypothetical protein